MKDFYRSGNLFFWGCFLTLVFISYQGFSCLLPYEPKEPTVKENLTVQVAPAPRFPITDAWKDEQEFEHAKYEIRLKNLEERIAELEK